MTGAVLASYLLVQAQVLGARVPPSWEVRDHAHHDPELPPFPCDGYAIR